MSGFLERLVAHHASVPAIRPRLISRFEEAGPVRVEAIEMLADAEPGSRPSGPSAVATEAADETLHLRHVAAAGSADEGSAAARGPAAAVHRAGDGPRRADAPTVDPYVDGGLATPSRASATTRAAEVAAIPPRPEDASGPADARPAPPSGPVAPASIRVAQEGGRRDDATRAPAREPDAVSVHIGRIEVRAIVAAPEHTVPTPARPDPVRPLSLERYLSRGHDA
jgi:hypothetical protein